VGCPPAMIRFRCLLAIAFAGVPIFYSPAQTINGAAQQAEDSRKGNS